ncbi:MAG: hypothetical protein S4CHLAM7_07230 [Chlamydiae bacterium]|nr:hypothetical protein [Chlamydiota bacterium]
MIKKSLENKILKNSISLEKYSLNDFAWDKKSALDMLNSILNEDLGVLGGDVYQMTEKRLISNGENWFSEANEGEDKRAFFLRSKLEAIKYIQQFPVGEEENIIFAIVFT